MATVLLPPELDRLVSSHDCDLAPDTVFVLDADNRIVYCNRAWDEFAAANRAPHSVASSAVLGRDILGVCPDSVRAYYRDLYQLCRETRQPTVHGYHCSSPVELRVFRMNLEPVDHYLLVRNVLLEQRPHPGPSCDFSDEYLHEGLVTMCANCRRARNWSSNEWDWVPTLLDAEDRQNFSHGLCHPCSVFFYGERWVARATAASSSH